MNLKAVHLTFIAASAVLATWMGFWCFGLYRRDDGWALLLGTVVAFAAAVALGAYGAAFYRKTRRL